MYTHNYDPEDICYAQGMSIFQLPYFLIYLDPKVGWIQLNQENNFFLKFLLAMTHRSPSLYSRNMDIIDIVVARGGHTSGKISMFGVQYSEANLSHVDVFYMHNFSSKTLYNILCDDPMLISNSLCLHGHTMCYDGTCILSHYICDGSVDCPDGSDEIECSHVCTFSGNYDRSVNCFTSCSSPECVCNDLYFSCALGGCVPWSRVCDGVVDCPQGEDEQQCHFSYIFNATKALFVAHNVPDKGHLQLKGMDYECKNGFNISHVLVNDLVPDCPEQDDEKTYYDFLKNGSRTDFFPDTSLCKEADATTCVKNYRGVCYPRHLHCIYEAEYAARSTTLTVKSIKTCRNKAHLNTCVRHTCPSFFKCPIAYCIPVYAVCNGRIDCPNGEDENVCEKMSCPGFLLCRGDKLCIHQK